MKHREITGSLIERGGKYTAVLNLYDETGKRRQKSIALGIPVRGNKRKAQARLEELKQAYRKPETVLEQAKAGVSAVCRFPAGLAEGHRSHH